MDGDQSVRSAPKRNKISRCFRTGVRSVLHFLGIHTHSDDDEVWERLILERIENKSFGPWSIADPTDDATEGLVREVWSTVSEVLSEDGHMPHNSLPPDHTEDSGPEVQSVTGDKCCKRQKSQKRDWNQSAKSINDVSQSPMDNEQVLPTDSTAHSTNTTQDSSQGSPESDVQLKQEGNSDGQTANENPYSSCQNDQATNAEVNGSDEDQVPHTSNNDMNLAEKHKSVRFCEVDEKHNINRMEEAHLNEMKEIGTIPGVQLKDALDLAGGEVPSSKTVDEQKKLDEILNSGLLAYGKEAYRNYSLYVQIERKNKVRKLRESKELAMDKMEWRISKIDEIIDTARGKMMLLTSSLNIEQLVHYDFKLWETGATFNLPLYRVFVEYYQNPSGKAAQAWNDLRRNIKSNTTVRLSSDTDVDIRFKLTKLHSHRPIFTNTIMLIQLLVFGVLCYFGGITKIGFEPVLELSEGIPTFLGTETVHRWVKPNIWIGPNEKFWISVGALFSSCMREDYKLMLEISKKNYSSSAVLGCCEVANRNTAGTMTHQECDQETGGVGVWKSGVPCGSRPIAEMSVSHNIKPCCVNTKGECRMVSHQHCHFLKGIYHQDDREHCSQVNCISDFCTGKLGFMIPTLTSKPDKPWLPEAPQQIWRLPLSVLYHYGIIHCLLVVGAQWMLLRQIEVTTGWLRMMILYIVCGCGGLLAAVIFNPYQPHVGATGALFGAVGLLLVELIHFWSIIKRPWMELVKLLTFMAIFIFSGTLPYLNIFSILIGLLLGMLCALGLLPYISIKRHKALCRIVVVAMSVPLVITIFFVMFYIFYKVQLLENCKFCKFVNCYPYTENMCKLLD